MGQKQYIWQKGEWPHFKWDSEELIHELGKARKAQGKIIAQADFIGLEAQADLVVEEALTTSTIEGEKLNKKNVRSSVAKRLGLPAAGLPESQRHVDGLVQMLLDATQNANEALTQKRLFGWHAGLFPTGHSGIHSISVAKWRTGSEPMRVISQRGDKEIIHYEAPSSKKIPAEMKQFLEWWKRSRDTVDGLIRAGLAHFWFVSIHPFDDGNGRIARAITDMALTQDEQTQRRLYSLSAQILKERNSYYEVLEESQKESADITRWLNWFLKAYRNAIANSQGVIDKALKVSQFWQEHKHIEMNERQLKVVNKILENGAAQFEGGMTNKKYVSITKTSPATAKRDLADLEKKGILKKNSSKGRSVSYRLVE